MRKQLPTPRGKFKMPGKRRRYNVRFPPGRIKKIMQKDTEVGRMAMAVPVVISKVLEMFLRSLLTKANLITQSRHSRTLSVNHVKQCIDSERTFDFLRALADQAYATSSTKETQEKGSWSQHRRRWQDIPVKAKPSKMEEAPKSKMSIREPLYDDNSSSESELYICLDT